MSGEEQLKTEFEKCVKLVNSSKPGSVELSNTDKLKFYAIFKQATVGDFTGARPSMVNLIARYKYDAWKKLTDSKINKRQAMQMFIDEFKKISPPEIIAKL